MHPKHKKAAPLMRDGFVEIQQGGVIDSTLFGIRFF
jgi:hypothetical protein